MAECICCGKKFGRLDTYYLFENEKICEECYEGLGANLIKNLENSTELEHYEQHLNDIFDRIDKSLNSVDKKNMLKEGFFNIILKKYESTFGKDAEGLFAEIRNKKEQRIQEEKQKTIDIENKKKTYANSFNEFYEYDVVTIINENHGTVDRDKMMRILSEHSKNGWKLHTIYSNELGKNALRVLGFGVNSTACEDVMIFERRIQELD